MYYPHYVCMIVLSTCLCKEVCSPPTMTDGRVSSPSKTIYKSGDVLTITCNVGYVPISLDTTCQSNRSWIWGGEELKCSVVTCNRPLFILNGWLIPDQHTYDYNTTVVLSCNDGYEVKEGTARRTCFEDGTWGPMPIDCFKIICNDTVNVRHESIKEYPVISYSEVGRVVYNSSFFHLQKGSAEVICSADRKLSWMNSPLFGR